MKYRFHTLIKDEVEADTPEEAERKYYDGLDGEKLADHTSVTWDDDEPTPTEYAEAVDIQPNDNVNEITGFTA